jgi:hypothetical protein
MGGVPRLSARPETLSARGRAVGEHADIVVPLTASWQDRYRSSYDVKRTSIDIQCVISKKKAG